MNRLGWAILILICVTVGGFLAMTRFGGPVGRDRFVSEQPAVPPVASAGNTGALPTLAMPIAGVDPASLVDSWGDPRADGRRLHHGTDILAPAGTPVLAVADGTIEKLFESDDGGTTLYERGTDRHWQFYYAHLAGYAPGIHEGQIVHAGQALGFVGDTGNAGAGNYQLHLGLSFMRPGDGWWEGQAVNPYPLLAAGSAAR